MSFTNIPSNSNPSFQPRSLISFGGITIIYDLFSQFRDIGLIKDLSIRDNIEEIVKFYNQYESRMIENNYIPHDYFINYLVWHVIKADYAFSVPVPLGIIIALIEEEEYFDQHPYFEEFLLLIAAILSLKYVIPLWILEKIYDSGNEYLFTVVSLIFGLPLFFWVLFYNPFPLGYFIALTFTNEEINHGYVYGLGLKGIEFYEGSYRGALAGFYGIRLFYKNDFYFYGLSVATAFKE